MGLGQKGHRAPAGTRLPSPAEPSRGANKGPRFLGCTVWFSAEAARPPTNGDPHGQAGPSSRGHWPRGAGGTLDRLTQETDNRLTYKITCSLVPFGSEEKPHCI